MALALNNATRYVNAEADYDSVHPNPHWTPPNATKRQARAMKAANGGDVSQLGATRMTLDHRLQLFVPTTATAYFQPDEFDLDDPAVICAKVSVTLDAVTEWDDDMLATVQDELIPKEDLSEAEIEQIVTAKMASIADELTAYCHIVASFINSGAAGNNSLHGILVAVADDIQDVDTRTVAAGATNEQVPAITAEGVATLGVEHMTTVSEHAPRTNPTLLAAVSALTGSAYYAISPKLAAVFAPYSTAIEEARVSRVTAIDSDLIDGAINYDGLLDGYLEAGTLAGKVVISVIRVSDLNPDYLNSLTDQEFTEDELTALGFEDTALAVDEHWASARAKVLVAVAATGSDWVSEANGGDDDAASLNMYEDMGSWTAFAVTANELGYLIALGKYALSAYTTRVLSIQNMSAEALADFSITRMNTINHELHGTCGEVHNHLGELWGAISLPKSLFVFDASSDDIVGQIHHATAHISYTKSGHHASANNIGHTLTKLLDAVDYPYDISDIPERLAAGTYYGSKPADQRAVAVYLRAKYAQNELSFAIGRRITPHGPGTVSMFLLNMVVEQLQQVEFFSFMKREEAYTQFKGMYTSYAKTSYLEVPYANYFYGKSKAESVDLKQAVAPMFAYAAAIAAAMPNSTIGDSVALRREATSAASNSITARLEVESFVRAYRTFLRTLIRGRLSKKAGVQAGNAQIEDADE